MLVLLLVTVLLHVTCSNSPIFVYIRSSVYLVVYKLESLRVTTTFSLYSHIILWLTSSWSSYSSSIRFPVFFAMTAVTAPAQQVKGTLSHFLKIHIRTVSHCTLTSLSSDAHKRDFFSPIISEDSLLCMPCRLRISLMSSRIRKLILG